MQSQYRKWTRPPMYQSGSKLLEVTNISVSVDAPPSAIEPCPLVPDKTQPSTMRLSESLAVVTGSLLLSAVFAHPTQVGEQIHLPEVAHFLSTYIE